MTFKKIGMLFVAMLVVVGAASAAKIPPDQLFQKGKLWVTPQIGLYSWGGSIPFGANVEYALTPNIGIGGTVMAMFWSEAEWSESIVSIAAEAAYHFTTLKVDNLDLYAGGGLGYSIYSWSWKSGFIGISGGSGSSGIYIETVLGGRYYFSPKMAVSLRLVGSLTGFSGFGAQVGLSFNLK
jgi:hypothetical protein